MTTLRIEDVEKIIRQQQGGNIQRRIRRVPGQSPILTFGLPLVETTPFAKKVKETEETVSVTTKSKKSTKGTFQQSNKNRGAGRRMRNSVKSRYSCRNCSGYL